MPKSCRVDLCLNSLANSKFLFFTFLDGQKQKPNNNIIQQQLHTTFVFPTKSPDAAWLIVTKKGRCKVQLLLLHIRLLIFCPGYHRRQFSLGMNISHGNKQNISRWRSENIPTRADSRDVRIDPLHFLAGCRTRRLNQALSIISQHAVLLYCGLLGPLSMYCQFSLLSFGCSG